MIMNLSSEEVTLIEEFRKKQEWLRGFGSGIDAACRKIVNIAEQRAGGSGDLNNTDRLFLDAIRHIDPDKGY